MNGCDESGWVGSRNKGRKKQTRRERSTMKRRKWMDCFGVFCDYK